ncbi:Osmosensitive K channel His kinase sensor [Paenibacillus algicola]|uniref:histidine kinase n=1 Tax=Paenibacillus algicola TaxID=2565926 RepID=A0A4P8XQZ5_9BACL|nr:DUF4118 domain-containing protein [Paenibacillus algicola]QCT04785.1 Osmosensitive K channel His kinase sensor [Paenibacillus algicola]
MSYRRTAGAYACVTLLVASLTFLLWMLGFSFDLVNIALIYLLPVLLSAVYAGKGPSLYAAALSVLAFDVFFVPPVLSVTVEDLRYLISFVIFLAVAGLTASLADRLKQQLQYAKRREAQTALLLALSKEMGQLTEIPSLLASLSAQIARHVECETAFYLVHEGRGLERVVQAPGFSRWEVTEKEAVLAEWVFTHRTTAGRGAETLPEASGLFLPISSEDSIFGVMAVNLKGKKLAEDARPLLEALAGLAANTMARIRLSEEAKLAQLTAESEKLRNAILDSVSHELRTPLATITGSVTALIEGERIFSSSDRLELLSTVEEGARRMNRLVSNLLGMVQLESGMLQLRQSWCDIEDIVGVVQHQVKELQRNRMLHIRLQPDLGWLRGDQGLLELVLVNILSNSFKYSHDYSLVTVDVRLEQGSMNIRIADEGIGVDKSDQERIFDKFYRAKHSQNVPGTGLGLAICKGIIDLHGGSIKAETNDQQGLTVTVRLPVHDRCTAVPLVP